MLTKERIEEIRVAVGDASADPMAPAELAELLAARDVAEALSEWDRHRRDRADSFHRERARWDIERGLIRYEQAKRGTTAAILLHIINRESEASA